MILNSNTKNKDEKVAKVSKVDKVDKVDSDIDIAPPDVGDLKRTLPITPLRGKGTLRRITLNQVSLKR